MITFPREFPVKTERKVREEVTETRAHKVCLAGTELMVCEDPKATLDLLGPPAVMVGWERLVQWVQLDPQEPWWRGRRCRDLLVLMVWMEPQECLETLDPREKWEPEEIREPEELLEKMDCKVLQVLRGKKDEWATWANPACRVRRETLVPLVSWDPPAYKEPPDCLDSRASRGSRDCQETPGRREEKETQGQLELTGRTELMGSPG